MGKNIKANLAFNIINTGTQLLFPLVTFPYVCRIIGVEGVGQVEFLNSIISYIYLFTSLGIPMYAIREIARVRDDIKKMNQIVVEILILHLILTALGYVIVGILCIGVPQIAVAKALFIILSLNLFFLAIGCEWFYQGIEDFGYITIRGLCVRIVSAALLFLFVKSEQDLLLYGAYCVIGTVGSNVFNFFRLRKYVHTTNIVWANLNIKRHLFPATKVFAFNVITSLYLKLNPMILGFFSGNAAVGFYTAATKILAILITMTTCLSQVIMPRASKLIADDNNNEYSSLIQKSFDFTLFLSIPLSIGLICTAPFLIRVFCGESFEESIIASQIVAPIAMIVGISNVLGIQILYPRGEINKVIVSCGIGALADLILCFLFIPSFSYIGAAIAYLVAECATTISLIIISRKKLPISLNNSHLHFLLAGIIMILALFYLNSRLSLSDPMMLLVNTLIGALVYVIYLIIVKDSFVQYSFESFKNIIKR